MLSMDQINFIKSLAADGHSTREIASATGFNRETVMKYMKQKTTVPQPFRQDRPKKIDPYLPYLKDLLKSDSAISNRKLRLTAKRVHELVCTGQLTDELPALAVSIRTIERVVAEIRSSLVMARNRQHLKLLHCPGEAQIDFGEVTMLSPEGETRHFILVMTFPYSNFRMAQVLPAQNFECPAYGLSQMFGRIGRVPRVIRCDNMSTAVSKIIRREDLGNGQCNHDAKDHPRRLTDNFYALKMAYGFGAEFCNPASGNEKGSVENAVGWTRRNFFCPLRGFDGNYEALNEKLARFCLSQAKQPHYRHKPKTIEELFKEDLADMLPLPDDPGDVHHSWGTATVTEDCRVRVDTNEYQLDLLPKTKICVKKFWNKLAFFTERGKFVSEHARQYGFRKDSIDWSVELKMLCDRPSAFNNSYLQAICPEGVRAYLRGLSAPKRALLMRALLQRVSKGKNLTEELALLDQAIRAYGTESVEVVVNGYRGAEDKLTDSIKPMQGVSATLGDMSLPPRQFADVCNLLEGRGNA